MIEPAREHCRSCGCEVDLVVVPGTSGQYIDNHEVHHWLCPGSGKRSLEFRDRNRAAREARIVTMVDRVKLDAEIAFDAWQEDRTDFNYELMVGIALKEYGRRFPSSRAYKRYVTERLKGGAWSSYKIDVFCTLCRGLLVPRLSAAANPEAFPKVNQHTTGCALLCLSGRREMVAPGEKRLIDEDRAFADDEESRV